ncbi:hypothetical protein BTR23_07445 [Alkalihalophilus pseudofirmus]|nr:hypothetical protein BTR23_07445 [Alkalihalophilus pseudofirmus]
MKAGELKDRLIIQTKVKIPDDGGGYEEDWIDGEKVWSKVTPLSGVSLYRAKQMNAEITHEVKLRYRELSKEENRFKYKSDRILEIESMINVDELNEELLVTCKEVIT